jgi:hypothetical protein
MPFTMPVASAYATTRSRWIGFYRTYRRSDTPDGMQKQEKRDGGLAFLAWGLEKIDVQDQATTSSLLKPYHIRAGTQS